MFISAPFQMAQKEKETSVVVLNSPENRGETAIQAAEGYLRDLGLPALPDCLQYAFWAQTRNGGRNLFIRLPTKHAAQVCCARFQQQARTMGPPPTYTLRPDLTAYQREVKTKVHTLIYWCRYYYGHNWKWRVNGAGFIEEYEGDRKIRDNVPIQKVISLARSRPPARTREGPFGTEKRVPETIDEETFTYIQNSPLMHKNLIKVFSNVGDLLKSVAATLRRA